MSKARSKWLFEFEYVHAVEWQPGPANGPNAIQCFVNINVVAGAICGKSIPNEASFDGIASINLGTISPESTDISIHTGVCCASCSIRLHLDDILSTTGRFFPLFPLSKLDYDINCCSINSNFFALCHLFVVGFFFEREISFVLNEKFDDCFRELFVLLVCCDEI